MAGYIQQKWNSLLKDLSQTEDYWKLTPTNYSMHKIITGFLKNKKYASVLDLGAGNLAFKSYFKGIAEKYIAVDISKTAQMNMVASGLNLPFKDNTFDLVICSAVIEHTEEPVRMIDEIFRVLMHEGELLLTAPHIHYLHDEPHDYWRFTRFGIQKLLKKAKFSESVIEIREVGYFINFIFSLTAPVVGGILNIKIMRKFTVNLLKLFSMMSEKFDKFLKINKMPLGYIAFAKKI